MKLNEKLEDPLITYFEKADDPDQATEGYWLLLVHRVG